jgi:flavin-dependent dehydrogenase
MKTDVVIIGAGPGGSVSALFLAQKGIKSVIVEQSTFPRFQIGESLTGEAGKALKGLGLGEKLDKLGCYIKQGVRVYGRGGKNQFWVPVTGRTDEGEIYDSTTWHVRRSDFDQLLLDEALETGTTFVQGQASEPLLDMDGSVCGLRVKKLPDGKYEDIHSQVVIDASGSASFLSTQGIAAKKQIGAYDKQLAIFSQIASSSDAPGTLIFYQQRDHWAWYIPLDRESISVGVVTPASYFRSKQESREDFLLRELRELNPELAKRVANPELIEEVRGRANYSYWVREFTGKGYLCVGDAHRFVDPIFSFGVHLAISEARKAAEEIEAYLAGEHRDQANPFLEYQQFSEQGQDVIQSLIDAFWNHPIAFALFVHRRYVEDMIDIFAGRIYNKEHSRGLKAMRTINAQSASGGDENGQ